MRVRKQGDSVLETHTIANGDLPHSNVDILKRLFDSLAPGGLFPFDVAGPERAPGQLTRTFVEGEGWTVLVERYLETSDLCRRIVTYRRSGALYRRDSELHRLQLVVPGEIVSDRRAIGFEVEEIITYEAEPLPRGGHGFIAYKPRQPAS